MRKLLSRLHRIYVESAFSYLMTLFNLHMNVGYMAVSLPALRSCLWLSGDKNVDTEVKHARKKLNEITYLHNRA